LPTDIATGILNDFGERVREGQRLHSGQRIGDLLKDVDKGPVQVELVTVDDAADRRYC
jgi:hypothetical protein